VLAELALLRAHVLLLDEPTNNLDLDGVHALGEALLAYRGAYVIASHDVAFLKETCTTATYHLKKGELIRLEDGPQEYAELVRNEVARKWEAIR
jgi:ATP-binding cassette subfamily F protein 2